MKPLPKTENPLVLRADFSNQSVWKTICAEIQKPVGPFQFPANVEFFDELNYKDITKEQLLQLISKNYDHIQFRAYVEFVDDPAYQDITKEQLLQLVPKDYDHSFIILVDEVSISHPESPLLIVDLYDELGREFRAIPSQIQGIENNLSIANMCFYEIAELIDDDGIFRGLDDEDD